MADGVAVMHWLRERFINPPPMRYSYLRKATDMQRAQLKQLIGEYVDGLETTLTEDSCLCEWIEMPTALGVRKIKSTVNLDCPVHTREGLILAFVEKHMPGIIFPERNVNTVAEMLNTDGS